MLKKFVVAFAILALALATAGTVPGPGSSYKVTLLQPSVVKGNELKAGEYRLNLGVEKVTIVNGKKSIEVPVKVELADKKFEKRAKTRKLSRDGRFLEAAFVEMAEEVADEDVVNAYHLNANCYISKPVGLEQFLKVVNAIENFWLTVVKLPSE